MAIITNTMAAKSCHTGHSPTIKVALKVPINGMAMMLIALVAGGKLRARLVQMVCAKP